MTRLTRCPYCGGEHPVGVRFCPVTGRTLTLRQARPGALLWLWGCAGLLGVAVLALGAWFLLATRGPTPPTDLIGWIVPAEASPTRPTRTPRASVTPSATPRETLAASPTPAASATPSAVPSPTWTPLPRASATSAVSIATADPGPGGASAAATPCALTVAGRFAALWASYAADLGCPRRAAEAQAIQDAEQAFQNGHMLCRADLDVYYVIYDGGGAGEGSWSGYGTKYNDGGLAACSEEAPAGLVKPRSGFGNIWCALGGGAAAIGWGLDQEYGFGAGRGSVYVQDFERGLIFQDSDGVNQNRAYVLFTGGRFVRATP